MTKELLLETEWKGEPVRSVMDKKKLKWPARGETPSGAGKKAERGKNGWVCRRHCWVRLMICRCRWRSVEGGARWWC